MSQANDVTPPSQTSSVPVPKRSCVLCQQRKVKCDRTEPCSNCKKGGVECVYRAPEPQRRRKKRDPQVDLLNKLKRYEDLLKKAGVSVEEVQDEDVANGNPHDQERSPTSSDVTVAESRRGVASSVARKPGGVEAPEGRLIFEEGQSRYLESNMWRSITQELADPKDVLLTGNEKGDEPIRTDGGDIIFGFRSSDVPLHSQHPSPVHIYKLWQIYLENVNPLNKLVHAPSMNKVILGAIENTEQLSDGMHAIIFSLYSGAVVSLTSTECEETFGEDKNALLGRYVKATHQALVASRFLRSSDQSVLTAFLIYIFAVGQYYDPRSLWTVMGIVLRIAQRIGLHRDGDTLGLPPFQSEMRRRLWWQIGMLEGRTSELAGCTSWMLFADWDVRPPLNVNDSDLDPKMTELPPAREGATEMIFVSLRFESGKYFLKQRSMNPAATGPAILRGAVVSEVERRLEDVVLKNCDPSLPLHLFSAIVARGFICSMKLRVGHPRNRPDGGENMPAEEKDVLFDCCVKLLEYDNMVHSTKVLQRFLWHTKGFFQYDAFVFLLNELSRRTIGDEVEKAWQKIEEMFANHIEMITATKSAPNLVVANLALKSWAARESDYASSGRDMFPLRVPGFITTLRSQRVATKQSQQSAARPMEDASAQAPQVILDQGINNISSYLDPTFLPESRPTNDWDWNQWDDLFREFDPQAENDPTQFMSL